jgi:sialic acid synthase SpsE
MSTGCASVVEIEAAIKWANAVSMQFPIMYHCVMDYPCKPENARLSRIHTLADLVHKHNYDEVREYPDAYKFVGYSDHTASLPVVLKALSWINICELHFDLNDRAGSETHVGHCWTTVMLTELCDALATVDKAMIDADNEGPDLRADPTDGLRPRLQHRRD